MVLYFAASAPDGEVAFYILDGPILSAVAGGAGYGVEVDYSFAEGGAQLFLAVLAPEFYAEVDGGVVDLD
jgi:hypothetical protein